MKGQVQGVRARRFPVSTAPREPSTLKVKLCITSALGAPSLNGSAGAVYVEGVFWVRCSYIGDSLNGSTEPSPLKVRHRLWCGTVSRISTGVSARPP